MMINDITQLQG